MSPKINFSSLVNLFKTAYAVQGQSLVEHGFQNGENKSGTISITKTIRKIPNKWSKADGRPLSDDSMTGQWELGTTSRTVGPESCCLSTFKPLVIFTYNVRALHQQGKIHQLFMGWSDVGIDIIGTQKHRLITKEPTEELWSDDKTWVLVFSCATSIRDKEELVFWCQSISINACKVWHQLPSESSQLHSMEIPYCDISLCSDWVFFAWW